MGVRREATLEEVVLNTRRRRSHRTDLLKDIEIELRGENLNTEKEDVCMWKRKSGYKKSFSTYETWLMLRESKSQCSWARGVWISQATPKYAFMAWLSVRNRMSTLDRAATWSQSVKAPPNGETIYSLSAPIQLRSGNILPKECCETPTLMSAL
ncbi:uncharacterized protein LOC125576721 [Brassica napus]|uniref:uncharacterized protein LOC125576721 n=1 Tax=Brassica napus TaxID=3708 RepID=UPI0020789B69|nr:uncharacterized protein LOC125576721 [Brassica napus]